LTLDATSVLIVEGSRLGLSRVLDFLCYFAIEQSFRADAQPLCFCIEQARIDFKIELVLSRFDDPTLEFFDSSADRLIDILCGDLNAIHNREHIRRSFRFATAIVFLLRLWLRRDVRGSLTCFLLRGLRDPLKRARTCITNGGEQENN